MGSGRAGLDAINQLSGEVWEGREGEGNYGVAVYGLNLPARDSGFFMLGFLFDETQNALFRNRLTKKMIW